MCQYTHILIAAMTKESFWITNISKMNVSLADLNLTVKSFTSINLLDSRHYDYTKEQLDRSAKSGSLFAKRKMISVRNNAPKIIANDMPIIRTVYDRENKSWSEDGTYIPGRERSVLEIKNIEYEELNVGEVDGSVLDKKAAQLAAEEKFAAENADLASLDEQVIQKHKG